MRHYLLNTLSLILIQLPPNLNRRILVDHFTEGVAQVHIETVTNFEVQ